VIEFFLSTRLNVMVMTPASVWVKDVAHGRSIGQASVSALAHEIEPVLAPEHLVADEEGRGAEDAAVHGSWVRWSQACP
jgi:hypothetical protein